MVNKNVEEVMWMNLLWILIFALSCHVIYCLFRTTVASGKITECYIEANYNGFNNKVYYSVSGNIDWRSDDFLGRAETLDEASVLAKQLCPKGISVINGK